jgi:type II secretory pathway pseudopilin PulG
MLRQRLSLKENGDTIIEVMIVLAVLGLAIAIAYATANRSLLNARQAQESSQATALAQSQIEALRTLTADTSATGIFQPGPYCISSTYTVVTGSSCKQFGTIPYAIDITFVSATNTFTVKTTWPDIRGEGDDSVTLVYRIYQQS